MLNKRLQDPTRTSDIRHSYQKDIDIRLNKIRSLVRQAIIVKQAFQFDINLIINIDAPNRIEGNTPETLISSFMAWFKKIEDEILLEVTRDGNGNVSSRNPWQDDYVQMTYVRAIKQSELLMQAQGLAIASRSIRQLLNDPFHSSAIVNLYNVNYAAFQTVIDFGDDAIAQLMRQELIAGYAETTERIAASGRRYLAGPTRRDLSKRIFEAFDDRFSKIIKTRSEMIVRTEIIRAHSEASLNSMEERHIGRAVARVEYSPAPDVCPICIGQLQGQIFTVPEARGLIPVHVNCKCAWVPVVDEVMANRIVENWYKTAA